jgi:hypothetical protein
VTVRARGRHAQTGREDLSDCSGDASVTLARLDATSSPRFSIRRMQGSAYRRNVLGALQVKCGSARRVDGAAYTKWSFGHPA